MPDVKTVLNRPCLTKDGWITAKTTYSFPEAEAQRLIRMGAAQLYTEPEPVALDTNGTPDFDDPITAVKDAIEKGEVMSDAKTPTVEAIEN